MAKLIAVSEEAYDRLSRLKSKEKAKSFTAVIMELTKQHGGGISTLFGAWKMSDKESAALKRRIKKERESIFAGRA
jgi:predicted CopG family antitoxin